MPTRLIAALVVACLLISPASADVVSTVVAAIVQIESGGNDTIRGAAGEWGRMQIKCKTARSVGFRGPCSGLANRVTNVRVGTAYFRGALKNARGDLQTAISLYQRGIWSKYRGCSDYCGRVLRAMRR